MELQGPIFRPVRIRQKADYMSRTTDNSTSAPSAAQTVYAARAEDAAAAEKLAEHLGWPMAVGMPNFAALAGVALLLDAAGLALVGDGMSMQADLTRMLPRLQPANLSRELLVRAARVRGLEGTPTAVDATAGFGDDALLLAAAGFTVTMFERDPVIAALLDDALRRAASDPRLADIVCRMELREGDSTAALPQMTSSPDVVLLDPMFPQRTKSAAVKKKFQLLHHLECPCADEAELLAAALAAHPRKVVVKRPVKAPFLAGVKPSHSISGKAVRYDCLVPTRS